MTCNILVLEEFGCLRFFRDLVPKYVYDDAGYIMKKPLLGGRRGTLAALTYSAKRYGVPLSIKVFYSTDSEKRTDYSVY